MGSLPSIGSEEILSVLPVFDLGLEMREPHHVAAEWSPAGRADEWWSEEMIRSPDFEGTNQALACFVILTNRD